MGAPAISEALAMLGTAVREARDEFASGARPTAGALDRLAARLVEAGKALATAAGGPLSDGERLAVAAVAAGLRADLAVLARLAAGGAAFTALLRELDGTARRAGLYGAGGAGQEGVPPSVERRV